MVYLITNREEGICKIGYSQNPRLRIIALQVGNPFPLTLESTIKGSVYLEKELHKKFNNLKLEGEWFDYTDEIKKYFNVTEERYYNSIINSDWINNIKNIQDMKTFLYMVEFQDNNSNVIIFTALQIDQCSTFFKCTSKTIKNSISSLINTGFLVRVASHNFVSNPYTFYKGGSKGLIEKIEMWNVLKSK